MKEHRLQTIETDHDARSGFTLMEVALAVVVVAIGMMAAFALISTGLDSSAKAVAMTRASIFADDVFNGLRSKAFLATDAGEGQWEQFWTDFIARRTSVTVAAGPMWQLDISHPGGPWNPAVTNYVSIQASRTGIGGVPVMSISLTNYCHRTGALSDIPNSALRYALHAKLQTMKIPTLGEDGEPLPEAQWDLWTNKVSAILNVWEGQYGETVLNQAMTFATEFENSGGL